MKQFRIGYLSTMYHTSQILKGRGLVERDLGAAPQWRLFGTGPAMVEAFGRGELDLGYIGLPPAMIGVSRGLPLKCVAGGHIEGTVIIAPAGGTEAGEAGEVGAALDRFGGQKIGAPARGSIHDIIVRRLLQEHGIAAEVVNYPWADLIPQAIADGDIAAAAGTPPLAEVAARWYGCRIIIPPRLIWPFNPSYGIVAHASILTERQFLEGFLTIHEAACNLIRLQPDEAAAAVAGELKVVDADFVKSVFSLSPHYCAALPQEYINSAMAFVPVLREQGSIRRDLQPDEVFELSFISRAHPQAHHY